ncbi:hypothetical protein M438DRAFT_342759 [Aureobasidium pullulans EXF-150]|uniref:Uncharacterized protein n=1 Tax=Aureobasidium pullulans EXF-150 TaxID=1043002 RepID=A0A074XPZ4_AURPU|nr:uncharacterized protein M438DRAFT_342759 [Aureobasidium pullulans EXF-150]KEQ87618.1 hypothetical protein M438DRAFT_342759 [Aureobasidium pullulans EXF-150]
MLYRCPQRFTKWLFVWHGRLFVAIPFTGTTRLVLMTYILPIVGWSPTLTLVGTTDAELQRALSAPSILTRR